MAGTTPLVAARMAAGWTSLALLLGPASAQVFRFDSTPVPVPYALTTHYMFYVYAGDDASATVEFRELASTKAGSLEVPARYDSIEVSIVPHQHFWSLINKDRFCSTTDDIRMRRADKCCRLMLQQKPSGARELVSTVSAPFSSKGHEVPKTRAFPIKKTGMYLLAFSNCGNYSGATVTGAVAVKNAHGYLPANEYPSLRIYGWFVISYLLLLLVWLSAMVRHFKTLMHIQSGMATILAAGLGENVFGWLEYTDWNRTGDRRDLLCVMTLLFYTIKYVLSWRLLLLAAEGVGVVVEDLDPKTSTTFCIVSALFMAQSSIWRVLISYRFSHMLDPGFLVVVTLPGVLICLGMFVWTVCTLSTATRRVEAEKQEMLPSFFGKVRSVLIGGFTLSVLVLSLQVVDIAYGGIFSWERQWVTVHGAPQLGFLLVFLAMMFVWWPSEDSLKLSYMAQPDNEEGEAALGEISESKDHKANAVSPKPIGARDEEEEEEGAMLF